MITQKQTAYKIVDWKLFVLLSVDYNYTIGKANSIIELANLNNYLQIIYTYGIECIRILLEFNEDSENYEECHKIKKSVDNYNKSTGENLKIK